MKKRFRILIALLFAFLTITTIAHGQSISKNTITIDKGLADTIIHDLEERKLLLVKTKIQDNQISILRHENNHLLAIAQIKEIELMTAKNKVSKRGWQRNFLALSTLTLGVLLLTK